MVTLDVGLAVCPMLALLLVQFSVTVTVAVVLAKGGK